MESTEMESINESEPLEEMMVEDEVEINTDLTPSEDVDTDTLIDPLNEDDDSSNLNSINLDVETDTIEDIDEGEKQYEENQKGKTDNSSKLVQLPQARIKQIIKQDEDVDRVTADAVFAITKATELFIQSFAQEIYKYTARAKKKTVQMKDINACINDVCCMQFLEGIFPEN